MIPKFLKINGVETCVDDKQSFVEFLSQFDIDENDAKELLGVDDATLQDEFEEKLGRYDGIIGDSYYNFISGLENLLGELQDDILDSLKGDGRKKGNRRQEIAKRLGCIVKNFDTLIH